MHVPRLSLCLRDFLCTTDIDELVLLFARYVFYQITDLKFSVAHIDIRGRPAYSGDHGFGIEKAIEDKICYAEILKALSPACLNKGDANEQDIQKAYEIIAPDQDRKDFFRSVW